MPNFAPGIPDRNRFEQLTKLPTGKLLDMVVQKHLARRAGPHTDLRLGNPELGLLSFAARKGLPEPGQKHLAIEQPTHSHSYGQFEGTIPSGYGAGTVKREEAGQAVVTKVTPDEVHFTTASRRVPSRFALIRPKKNTDDKHWLLLNTTPTKPIPYQKTHYTLVPKEQAEEVLSSLKPNSSVQKKIDGAAALARLGRKHVEVMSYRTSTAGNPIVHTEKLFGGSRPEVDIPKQLEGTILRGELYGVRGKREKAIEPQELGGILNATLGNSINKQQAGNIKLKTMLFDILQHGGQQIPRSMPYHERMKLLSGVVKHLPASTFHLPEEAHTPSEALKMWKQVSSGKDPLTHEGLVVHPAEGKPSKIKIREEHDVHFRNTFPGEGRLKDHGAGGFDYSWTPTGPIAGRVGTGLSDEMRQELHQNPDLYKGRLARVIAQEKLPSGALRAPAFLSFHEG